MALDFAAGLAEETSDNNDNGIRKAKNGLLKLGRKNPETVRIIPYVDRRFWFPYRVCWVDLYNKDHTKTFSAMLTFTYQDDGKDKLRSLIAKMIKANYQYRKDNPAYKKDIIQLQFPHNGHTPFYANLRPMFALQAIKIVQGADGTNTEQTFANSKMPMPQIMNVPKTVMSDISSSILSSDPKDLNAFADHVTGKPFPLVRTDATKMRWVNADRSFPVYIHLDSSNNYHVDPQIFDKCCVPLPTALYEKDKDGNYKHLDDPSYMYEPTKTRQPTIYQMAYDQLSKRYDEYKEGNHNAFADQVKEVKENTQKGQTSENTTSGNTQGSNTVPSNPANPFANPRDTKSNVPTNPTVLANDAVQRANASTSTGTDNNRGTSSTNADVSSTTKTPITPSSKSTDGSNSIQGTKEDKQEGQTKTNPEKPKEKSDVIKVNGTKINLSAYPKSVQNIIKNSAKNK